MFRRKTETIKKACAEKNLSGFCALRLALDLFAFMPFWFSNDVFFLLLTYAFSKLEPSKTGSFYEFSNHAK